MMTKFIYHNCFLLIMDAKKLEKLGLNKNEAIVYLALIPLGQASAGEIIKKTSFHRNIVYDNLEKLIDKGLVSFILEGKKKVFQLASPDMITEMLEKQQIKLNLQKEIEKDIKKEIKKSYKATKKQDAVIFRGVNGLKLLLKDTIKQHTDYYVFGAPKSSVNIMSSTFWKNYNKKLVSQNIIAKMLFNDDLRSWSKQIMNKNTLIKFLPKHFDALTETIVYGEKVAIIVWTEKPIATLIQDKEAAKGYKQHFNMLWKIAKS